MNFQERVNALIVELHSVGALKFGDFKMKVGINSPVYFDLRVIVSYPKLMAELADLMIQFTESRNVKYDRLCGVPYTALPIATLMAVQSNWPMLMRRKEPKGYGTKKLVEGVFFPGERILIVEDVVTSGSSILETCTDLRNSDLVVTDVVVVVDRQQGGASNLENNGIKIHPLVTLSQVMEILKVAGKVDEEMVKSVNHYTCINQIPVDGQGKFIGKSRMQLTFNERAKLTKCPISKTLFELMEKKKSTLCFAADVTSAQHLIELARAVGPYIVILKTHVDIISDFTKDTAAKLKELAKEDNFLIMEDRKFGDIGNTVKLQYSAHCSWADLVTVHALPGNGVFDALRGVFAEVNHEQKGIFVIAQLSSANNLITPNYTKEAVSLVEPYSDVIAGFVCQTSDVIPSPGLIQLTPGVNLSAKTDGLGQQYVRPDVAVLEKGADIVVVGRAIIESKFPKDTAAEIKNILWKVYEDRIRICS